MGTTANQSYPYPEGSSAVDVPGDMESLADALDVSVTAIEANDWVTTARIDDGAVTDAKLATDAVTSSKIDDGAVTLAKTSGVEQSFVPYQSGYWVSLNASRGTTNGAAGSVRAFRVRLPAGTLDRIACEVTYAQAGATMRLGIYEDNNGVVGSLLLDAGTIDASTTGVKEITISQAVTEGFYWLAGRAQSTANQATFRALGTVPQGSTTYVDSTAVFAATAGISGYRTGNNAGIVAADGLPATVTNLSNSTGAVFYTIGVRYA